MPPRRNRTTVASASAAAPFEPLESRRLMAVQLVADIETAPAGSSPSGFVEAGGLSFFAATDDLGRALWRSDGTAAGTTRVRDFSAGRSLSLDGAVEMGSVLYFTAPGTGGDYELWRSDGTPAGTYAVKDINPGPSGSNPADLTVVGNTLYFFAYDPQNTEALWKSDGTEAGTVLVADLPATSASSAPEQLTNAGGTLFFTGPGSAASVIALWKSDGTAAGTAVVREGLAPADEVTAGPGGRVFFRTSRAADTPDPTGTELWTSDGTADGTVMVKDLNPGAAPSMPQDFTVLGDAVYFTADGGPGVGWQLWKSDGTAAGTTQVSMFGAADVGPSHLTRVGDVIYFAAGAEATGQELWKTDGTPQGTVLVADLVPGAGFSSPRLLTAVDGVLMFTADTSTRGELWKTDGTEAGTVLVREIVPGTADGSVFVGGEAGGHLFFSATDAETGAEPWVSDGTGNGTFRLADLRTSTGDASPAGFIEFGGKLLFRATRSDVGAELWSTDGTAAGTTLVKDVYPGASGSNPQEFTRAGGGVLFITTVSSPMGPAELWRTDGTGAGTTKLANFRTFGKYSGALGPTAYENMVSAGGVAYFPAAGNSGGVELWKSDGTAAGTVMVKDIVPGSLDSLPTWLTAVGDTVYFVARDSMFQTQLWKTDGTAAGTVIVRPSMSPSGALRDPEQLTVVGSRLVFSASDQAGGRELWATDGTAAGTVRLADIGLFSGSSTPHVYAAGGAAGGEVAYFFAEETTGQSLWKTDGTVAGTARVKRFARGDLIRTIPANGLVTPDGRLYFTARDDAGGNEPWTSDGTDAGTVRVADVNGGAGSSDPFGFTLFDGRVFFSATDDAGGREAWSTDGTEAGTARVADLFPGPRSATPGSFVPFGGSLYLSALTPQYGRELWKYTPDDVPPPAAVVGRHVFYNGSAFDGDDAAADARDDGAVAPDKSALRHGVHGAGTGPGFGNVTSYFKGINGVMVDVAGLPGGVELTADDFTFRTGPREAPAPASVTVRRGAGANGSDRVTLVWADGDAVKNGWLRVTLKASERTGLASPDVFSFGNLVGETGDAGAGAEMRVTALDLAAVKRELSRPAPVASPYDFNRDGKVNALDVAALKSNLSRVLTPPGDEDDEDDVNDLLP